MGPCRATGSFIVVPKVLCAGPFNYRVASCRAISEYPRSDLAHGPPQFVLCRAYYRARAQSGLGGAKKCCHHFKLKKEMSNNYS